MKPERYQVSAVPVDGGEKTEGCILTTDSGRAFIVPHKAIVGIFKRKPAQIEKVVEVDPATIEPVRAKPIFKPDNDTPDILLCPNCNYDLMGGIETDADHDPPYCWECGQALDWSKEPHP